MRRYLDEEDVGVVKIVNILLYIERSIGVNVEFHPILHGCLLCGGFLILEWIEYPTFCVV